MDMPDGKPVSLWNCSKCDRIGIGDVRPDIEYWGYNNYKAIFDCEAPTGWWLSSEEILCFLCAKMRDRENAET
jgi:hypothetical protein